MVQEYLLSGLANVGKIPLRKALTAFSEDISQSHGSSYDEEDVWNILTKPLLRDPEKVLKPFLDIPLDNNSLRYTISRLLKSSLA